MCNKVCSAIIIIIIILAKSEYVQRHDNAASYIHWKVCRNYNIMTSADKWYEHKSKTVVENEPAKIMWICQSTLIEK